MHPLRALQAFFLVLFGKSLPTVWQATSTIALPEPAESSEDAGPEQKGAVRVLALLQSEGRFLDFLFEDIAAFSNEDVGAAAREVHRGCKQTLDSHFEMTAIRTEEEDSPITVGEAMDANTLKLTGKVPSSPPYNGILRHKGWRATDVRLPKIPPGDAAMILAPAELEMGE